MSDADESTAERSIQELIRSEAQLKTLIAGMLDPVITIDDHGTILSANESSLVVFGYKPDELVGQNIKLLMPAPYHEEHDGYLAHFRNTGTTNIIGRTREFPVVRKDGTAIDIELSVSRIELPDQAGEVYCGSFRDISMRKKAERALLESERRFRAIFDGEYQFVGLLDPDGTTLEINQTALEVTGMDRSEVIGKPFWQTYWWTHSVEDQGRVEQAVGQAASGEFVRFQVEVRTRCREPLIIDFSLKPIQDDNGDVVLLIPEGRDITEIKRAQQRETTMMRAFADIGESASLLAHEIKNPITAVNIALRAVAKQLGEDEQAILVELVDRMRNLERIMHRTLSLARPLELERTEVRVSELLESAAKILAPRCEDEDVQLEIMVDPACPAQFLDPQLIEEVLTNLITNALDAMGSGGKLRLEARFREGELVLCVDDDGPGIPDQVCTTLFKPFVTTKGNGTGLGLAISRKVIETHGGTLEVLSSPLGGARFEIRIPDVG